MQARRQPAPPPRRAHEQHPQVRAPGNPDVRALALGRVGDADVARRLAVGLDRHRAPGRRARAGARGSSGSRGCAAAAASPRAPTRGRTRTRAGSCRRARRRRRARRSGCRARRRPRRLRLAATCVSKLSSRRLDISLIGSEPHPHGSSGPSGCRHRGRRDPPNPLHRPCERRRCRGFARHSRERGRSHAHGYGVLRRLRPWKPPTPRPRRPPRLPRRPRPRLPRRRPRRRRRRPRPTETATRPRRPRPRTRRPSSDDRHARADRDGDRDRRRTATATATATATDEAAPTKAANRLQAAERSGARLHREGHRQDLNLDLYFRVAVERRRRPPRPDRSYERQRHPRHDEPELLARDSGPREDRRAELLHRQVPDSSVPAPDLPGRRHAVRHPLGDPRGHQRDRDRLRPQPERLLRRRAGLDAVHARHLEAVRRRRQPGRRQGPVQPGRRDLRRRALPEGRRRRHRTSARASSPTTTPTGTSTAS